MTPNQNFLDMFGNPVNVGDTIVYPAAAGSSAAQMSVAEVSQIIPIVPKDPKNPECRVGHTQTGTKIDQTDRVLFQRRVPGAPSETVTSTYGNRTYSYEKFPHEYDPDRMYILRVKRVREGSDDFEQQARTGVVLKNIDRIVVVTGLV
jgi:hypothetical protein